MARTYAAIALMSIRGLRADQPLASLVAPGPLNDPGPPNDPGPLNDPDLLNDDVAAQHN